MTFLFPDLVSKTVWHVTFSHVTYSLWENEFSSFCSSWLLSSFLSYFVVSTSKRVNKHLKHPLVFTFFRMEKFGWRALLFLIMSTVSPKWKPKIKVCFIWEVTKKFRFSYIFQWREIQTAEKWTNLQNFWWLLK